MYRNVLVPTDGSDAADLAVEEAYEIASRFDATLHALFVVDVEENYPFTLTVEPVAEGLRAEGERLTAEIADRAPDGVEAVAAVEEGSPDETIVEYADDTDVGLIVMGTHGRRGLDKFLLGSVTERVLQEAPCSVLVTRADQGDERVADPEAAVTVAREALVAEGYESVTVDRDPHERGGYWHVRAETGDETVDLRVDRLSGDVRTVDATGDRSAADDA